MTIGIVIVPAAAGPAAAVAVTSKVSPFDVAGDAGGAAGGC
jgi:hypothetical protein